MSITLIPVIDLKNGIVVHAKCGDRENYQPIKSVLTTKSDIHSVIRGFLALYNFDTIYIADLNAIIGQGDNSHLIQHVLNNFPEITFWIDAGYQKKRRFQSNYLPVLGSECFNDNNIDELINFEKKFILSLDFGAHGQKLGSQKIFTETEFWSKNVIIMTLNRVGSLQGAAIDLLTQFQKSYPKKNFIGAGGVRNVQDIETIKKIGIQHVLVASALHSGVIKKADFAKF